MRVISHDLHDIEALHGGRLTLQAAPTDVRGVLAACVAAVTTTRVGLDVGPEVPREVILDALRLRQVRESCCS